MTGVRCGSLGIAGVIYATPAAPQLRDFSSRGNLGIVMPGPDRKGVIKDAMKAAGEYECHYQEPPPLTANETSLRRGKGFRRERCGAVCN